MRVFRCSRWDALLAAYGVLQLVFMLFSAYSWESAGLPVRIVNAVVLAMFMAYNIIVVSHLFVHSPWFSSDRLNAAMSVLNSVNIGQSVQAYQLTHVRNHHRFNNDRPGPDGTTSDRSSTYRGGREGEHAPLVAYALGEAWVTALDRVREFSYAPRLWRVADRERVLLSLAFPRRPRRDRELRQIQADRIAHLFSLLMFASISWRWTLFCYIPAWFAALVMVNVQNYYRHYGADPGNRVADSVSHYGRIYNLIAFNDGYHQEHHLHPAKHWSQMPAVHGQYRNRLETERRIISPVPAMLGFLDRRRPLLHKEVSGS